MQNLNVGWVMEDITIRKAVLEDVERLNKICDSWKDKALLEGNVFDEDYVEKAILDPMLPPIENAQRECSAFMVVQYEQTIVGFFDCYQGYPDPESLWIGMFIMGAQYQEQHVGQRVIKAILTFGKQNGWKRCALAVYLKNWKGLRFWIHNGFKTIDRYVGDKQYAFDTYAMLVLSQEL